MTLSALRVLASLLLPLLAAACASTSAPQAAMDHDPQFDFTAVHEIYLQPFSRTDPATITVSDTQVARINAAIEEELRGKGFEIVPEASRADLFLSWYLVTEENIRSGSDPRYASSGIGGGGGKYKQGTLVVDMTDPMRNQAVWRSVFHSRLKARPDPEESDSIRRAATRAIFSDFPPSTGGTRP